MNSSERVMVYGAAGHTGRFVVDELLRRGLTPLLAGRDPGRLNALAHVYPGLEQRVAAVTGDLSAAVRGVAVVVNCAGPFLDTALPLATAAVAAGAHYLDVTAEQPAVQQLYAELDSPARAAGIAVVPAMAFYGGLADLLVTAALHGGTRADAVEVAIALDSWQPTAGTRVTGARNTAPRLRIRDGALAPLAPSGTTTAWRFPAPFGEQPVTELTFSEVTTIHRHLDVRDLTSYLTTAPLLELRDPKTPPPVPADASGRSAQRFAVDVVVRVGVETRRIGAAGRDIYASTAPLVVEGVARLLDGRALTTGAVAPAQAFDAAEVLAALADHLEVLTA